MAHLTSAHGGARLHAQSNRWIADDGEAPSIVVRSPEEDELEIVGGLPRLIS
jgi:hypothetical protein